MGAYIHSDAIVRERSLLFSVFFFRVQVQVRITRTNWLETHPLMNAKLMGRRWMGR